MKTLVYVVVCGALGLVVTSNQLPAQTATGAEARFRERNITLPPVPPPVANFARPREALGLPRMATLGNRTLVALPVRAWGHFRYSYRNRPQNIIKDLANA